MNLWIGTHTRKKCKQNIMKIRNNEQTKTTLAHFRHEINVWFVDPFTPLTRTDSRPVVRPTEGPNSFHWKNVKFKVLTCCTKFHDPHVVLESWRTLLKQYNRYESATICCTDHQYLAQHSEIINNLQEITLMFCNYAVRSCGNLT